MTRGLLERLSAWLRLPPAPSVIRPAALPGGLRVYAIGDIHGETALLDRLAKTIAADLAAQPFLDAQAIFLGDYIDRGPDSRGVIERLAARDFPLPFVALRGNHEDLMMQALGAPEGMRAWCHTGGLETLRSYGIDVGPAPREKSLLRWRDTLIEALPPSHVTFLDETRLSQTLGDYFFVHAGARPGVPLDRQRPEDLMWIRDECYEADYDFGKVLVHGHTPGRRPENYPRRINIDTGAFKWGVLTAVVLEGATRRFLSVGD